MGWERHRLGGLINNNLGGYFFHSIKPEVRFCTSCVLYAQWEISRESRFRVFYDDSCGSKKPRWSVKGAKAWFCFAACVARSLGDPG